jgi:hypothetical protein
MSQVEVTTPKAPKAFGENRIILKHPLNEGDAFVFDGYDVPFVPEDAVVTGVTNVSTDTTTNPLTNGVKLGLVRHTDAQGNPRTLSSDSCSPAALEPKASTPTFNGLTVKGKWEVRATCISILLLDGSPKGEGINVQAARIELSIAWTQ